MYMYNIRTETTASVTLGWKLMYSSLYEYPDMRHYIHIKSVMIVVVVMLSLLTD